MDWDWAALLGGPTDRPGMNRGRYGGRLCRPMIRGWGRVETWSLRMNRRGLEPKGKWSPPWLKERRHPWPESVDATSNRHVIRAQYPSTTSNHHCRPTRYVGGVVPMLCELTRL